MKHIIITGANGFVGYELVNYLLSKSYKVTAVVRNRFSIKEKFLYYENLDIIEAQMSDYKNLDKFISTTCDCVFSLAWEGVWGNERNNSDIQKRNYYYSLDLLKISANLGCKTFFTSGSQAEYGLVYSKIDENTKCNPVTEYGKYKLKFFNDASEFCKQKKIKFFEPRYFSLYGPGDNKNTLISSLIVKLLKNEDCKLTESTQIWDYLFITDAIHALYMLLEGKCQEGVYNIASGNYYPLKYFIELMHLSTKSSSKLLYGSIPYPYTGKVSIQPDVSKLIKETRWRPQISFEEGIKKIIEYQNSITNKLFVRGK